jgi:copper chaperone CopZ
MSIKKELEEIDVVSAVKGDAEKKEITVNWDAPASVEKIKETLKEINYPASE